jgi:hypothetical protein
VFAAERVGESEWFGQLFCADQEASAIGIPILRHKFGSSCQRGIGLQACASGWKLGTPLTDLSIGTTNQPAGNSFAVIVNLRAEAGVVNSQNMVQSENLAREIYAVMKNSMLAKSRLWRAFPALMEWRPRTPAPPL